MSGAGPSLVLNVRGGARMAVPPDVTEITTYVLLEQEDWFEDEIRFVRRALLPGMRAVDAGANHGLYAVAMARAVGSQGRVWAFEPAPAPAARMAESLRLNSCTNAGVHEIALSDRAGRAHLSAEKHSEHHALQAGASAGGFEVRTDTLDRLAAQQDWKDVDFVKLDVEGHELQVLAGGERFFATRSPLVMLETTSRDAADLRPLEWLGRHGYRPYRLVPGLLALAPLDPARDALPLNAFACRDDRAQMLRAAGLLADFPLAGPAMADPYVEGLDAFARFSDAGLSLGERAAALALAKARLAAALGAERSLAKLLSFARAASEAGDRLAAANALGEATGRLHAEGAACLAAPFLAPSLRYERFPAEERSLDWLRCAVIESFERLRSFSSIFTLAETLATIGAIHALPQASPEMERRMLLARVLTGQQRSAVASAKLRRASDENLNPQFWSAGWTLA